MRAIDEATSTFLGFAAEDLQRQLGIAGTVTSISIDDSGETVTLIATVRVGPRDLEVRGSGESLVAAYAALGQSAPEPILAAAFQNLL